MPAGWAMPRQQPRHLPEQRIWAGPAGAAVPPHLPPKSPRWTANLDQGPLLLRTLREGRDRGEQRFCRAARHGGREVSRHGRQTCGRIGAATAPARMQARPGEEGMRSPSRRPG